MEGTLQAHRLRTLGMLPGIANRGSFFSTVIPDPLFTSISDLLLLIPFL